MKKLLNILVLSTFVGLVPAFGSDQDVPTEGTATSQATEPTQLAGGLPLTGGNNRRSHFLHIS